MEEHPAEVPSNATKNCSKQICNAFKYLSDLQIIHGDLKLDNLLLTHPEASTIKLADFGSAFRSGEKLDPHVRAWPYRSPEFILNSKIGVPTDLWSLGGILVEKFTADILFAVTDFTAQINKFVEVMGMPPSSILDRSTRSTKFFEKTLGSDRYVLKKPRKGETYKAAGVRKIQNVLDIDLEGSMYEKGEDDDNFLYEYVDFTDLFLLVLKYNPSERITPCEALNHKFFNSPELKEKSCEITFQVDPYVRAWPYRSPEFIQNSKIGVPTDLWSLGGILVEIFTADILFAVTDFTAQINKFVEVMGMPPSSVLDRSTRSTKFFEKTPGSDRFVCPQKPRKGETYKAAGVRKIQDVLDIDLEGSMYEKGEDDDNFLFEYADFTDLFFSC
ncbi:hypothetical protein WA026_023625 [Henosepilachna vigintioctopunctata]|uniref:Protein kinase domain-containing protein n=1 Tax=Henosepilachna vigintioctopunctata TaxID=420089 RepID=A0AAW1USU3_9CUCU